jgi:predicted nucleic-acid-binding Zn-ribbon protein
MSVFGLDTSAFNECDDIVHIVAGCIVDGHWSERRFYLESPTVVAYMREKLAEYKRWSDKFFHSPAVNRLMYLVRSVFEAHRNPIDTAASLAGLREMTVGRTISVSDNESSAWTIEATGCSRIVTMPDKRYIHAECGNCAYSLLNRFMMYAFGAKIVDSPEYRESKQTRTLPSLPPPSMRDKIAIGLIPNHILRGVYRGTHMTADTRR